MKFEPDISCKKKHGLAWKIKGTTRQYCKHLKGRSHEKISSKNNFKCMVSRDCNLNFHKINHIFLKKRVNYSSFGSKICNIYVEFDHSKNLSVLYNDTMFHNPPSAVLTAQTIYQNLRQIKWLGPL